MEKYYYDILVNLYNAAVEKLNKSKDENEMHRNLDIADALKSAIEIIDSTVEVFED